MNTPIKILLVEDNPRDAEVTLRALRKRNLGNDVIHVKDGQQALDWLFGPNPDGREDGNLPKLVLLDLKLPKIDGLEVLKAIRSDPRTRLLPVVVMTSSSEQRDVVESYERGVNSYVVKPVEFDSFSAAVAELGHYWLIVNHPTR
jgi:two-component system, response regulator